MLKLEKIKWAQKLRQTWTHLGYKNNGYFQTLSLSRRRKNKIRKIKDLKGIWFDNQNEISKVFNNDSTKRFTSKYPRINLELFYSFSPCITKEENRDLIKVVTEKEILLALSQINNLKAHMLLP